MKSKKILSLFAISTLLALLAVSAFAAQAQAAVSWQVTITASLSSYSSTTILGVASDATTGFDAAYDVPASPAPPTGVYSYFDYPSNPPFTQQLSKSIIPESPSMTWPLVVQAVGISGNMQLSWTTIPSGYSAYIKDSTGTNILFDMNSGSQYTYSASSGVLITFQVNLVVPEYPLGIVMVLTGCFAAYGISKRALPKRL